MSQENEGPQCPVSLAVGEINYNCRLTAGHAGRHVTFDPVWFDTKDSWQEVEKKAWEFYKKEGFKR